MSRDTSLAQPAPRRSSTCNCPTTSRQPQCHLHPTVLPPLHADQPPQVTLSSSDITRIYEWADRLADPVICFARDVRRIKPFQGAGLILGGLSLYQHKQTPCLRVTVCGIVVGVIRKEDKTIYEVDDGTAVLRVRDSPSSLEDEREKRRSERLHSERHQPAGIPSCYIRPPSPERGRQAKGKSKATRLEHAPRFHVGALVKVTGRIKNDWDNERVLDSCGMVRLVDPNEESQHHLDAVRLAHQDYSIPLCRSRIQQLVGRQIEQSTLGLDDTKDDAANQDLRVAARRLIASSDDDEMTPRPNFARKRAKAAPVHQTHSARSLPKHEARMLISSQSDHADSVNEDVGRSMLPSTGSKPSNSRLQTLLPAKRSQPISLLSSEEEGAHLRTSTAAHSRSRASGYLATVKGLASQSAEGIVASTCRSSTVASSSNSSMRKLRNHQKLCDSKVTDTFFRLQVQKHISETYGNAGRFQLETRPAENIISPSFSTSNLISDDALHSLAKRVVTIKLERRTLATNCGRETGNSSENMADKIVRLFQWAIRQMMSDGFIILAPVGLSQHQSDHLDDSDIEVIELPPSSGDSVRLDRQGTTMHLALGSRPRIRFPSVVELSESSPDETNGQVLRSSKQASSRSHTHVDRAVYYRPSISHGDEERYQLVSSPVLTPPILSALEKALTRAPGAALQTDELLVKLKTMDERYFSLTREVIEEVLFDMADEGLVRRCRSLGWSIAMSR